MQETVNIKDERLKKCYPAAIRIINQGIELLKQVHTVDKHFTLRKFVLAAAHIPTFRVSHLAIGEYQPSELDTLLKTTHQRAMRKILEAADNDRRLLNGAARCESYIFLIHVSPCAKEIRNPKFLQILTASMAASWESSCGTEDAVLAIKREIDAIGPLIWHMVMEICNMANVPIPALRQLQN